jgi:hypothetical protein
MEGDFRLPNYRTIAAKPCEYYFCGKEATEFELFDGGF